MISLSIVLPVYRPNLNHFGIMLDSIVDQMLDCDELIFHFDDGDDSCLDPKYYHLPNVRTLPIVKGKCQIGVNQSFRRLVSCASNEIVVFADQDDCWIPGRLSRIRSFFSSGNSNKSVLSMRPLLCDSTLTPISPSSKYFFLTKKMPRAFSFLFNSCVGNCLSVRKDFFLYYTAKPYCIVGMYDWHIGVIASCLNQLHWDVEFGTYWRLHPSSATFDLRSSFRVLQKIRWRLRLVILALRLLIDPKSYRLQTQGLAVLPNEKKL